MDLDISMFDYASFVPALREAYLSEGQIETVPAQIPVTDADADAGLDVEISAGE